MITIIDYVRQNVPMSLEDDQRHFETVVDQSIPIEDAGCFRKTKRIELKDFVEQGRLLTTPLIGSTFIPPVPLSAETWTFVNQGILTSGQMQTYKHDVVSTKRGVQYCRPCKLFHKHAGFSDRCRVCGAKTSIEYNQDLCSLLECVLLSPDIEIDDVRLKYIDSQLLTTALSAVIEYRKFESAMTKSLQE